jgi:cytochrome c oxidase assembly protein subunit 15
MSGLVRWLRSGRGLATYAVGVLAFMVLVVLEGAVVRATGSGAGCGNHWPLCNGDFFPHHPRLATVIEYTHRSMTGFCSTLVVVLIVWVYQARAKGDRVRRAANWVGVLLLTEALLGALLVKGGYVEFNASDMRVFMQCIHFTNTMLLLAALALVTYWVREVGAPVNSSKGVAWLAVVATVVVGATGSVAALADTLFPSPSLITGLRDDFSAAAPLLVRMRWVHPAAALVGVVCVGWLCLRVRTRVSAWLAGLLVLQLVLGVGDVLLLTPTWMQVVHLLGADLYWIVLVIVAADVVWPGGEEDPLRG